MEEKRKHPRLKCVFKVRFLEEKELETDNFSPNGMFVKTAFAHHFALRETVHLMIYLPPRTDRPVTVESRIVNVMENGICVAFRNVSEIIKQRLEGCYDYLYNKQNDT
jgi:hypothetical protein